ncbi:MAG: hypothetical protein JWO37_341 [Acidimicrobiales bacterium]|nr:hypothetical protein [Acidimicrobiales bacterium]
MTKPSRWLGPVVTTTFVVVTAGPAAAHALHPANTGTAPDVGRWLSTAALFVFGPLVVGLAVAPYLTRVAATRRHRRLVSAALVAVVIGWSARPPSLGALGAFGVAHVAAASVWVGGVMHLALAWPDRQAIVAGARRFGPWALGTGAITMATGVMNVRRHAPGLAPSAPVTAYGVVLVLKVGIVAAAALLGSLVWRQVRRAEPTVRLVRLEAGGLVAVLGLASALAVLPAPPVATGLPVVATARAGDADVTVVVAPARAGLNLVQVAVTNERLAAASISRRSLAMRPVAGARGSAAAVRLPAGWSGVTVALAGGHQVRIAVPIARGGGASPPAIDDPGTAEYLDRAVGVALSGRRPIPIDGPDAATMGGAYRLFLDSTGSRSVVLVSDGSARAAAFGAGLRPSLTIAAGELVPRADAVVVATGRERAPLDVGAAARPEWAPTHGVLVAPWLLSDRVFVAAPTAAQVTVGLPLDPGSPSARAYLTRLAARAPGLEPSLAGVEAFLAATRAPAQAGMQFFTPADIRFLPPSLDGGHDHANRGWFGSRSLLAVSGLVR